MAEINLGKVRPVYKGGWSALSTYDYLDWVKYDESGYIAIKDVPAGTAPVEGGNEHWEIFGSKGQDGLNGVDGQNGPKGDKGDQGIQGIQGEQGEEGPPVAITSDWETNDPTIAFSSSGAYEMKQEIDAISGSGSSGLAGLTTRVEANETDIDTLQTFKDATDITLSSIASKNAEQDAEIFDLKNNDATTVQKGLVLRATTANIESRTGTGYVASQDLPYIPTAEELAGKVNKTGDTLTGALHFETSIGTSLIRNYSDDKSKSISYAPYVRNADSSTASYIRFLNDSVIALRINMSSGALSSDIGDWAEERVPMGQLYEAGYFGSTGTYTGNSITIGGVVRHISASNTKVAILPSYGSWLINMFAKNSSGQMTGNVTGVAIGQIIAGGTTIGSSSSSSTITGYVIRVA